jgi:hypothetical protein
MPVKKIDDLPGLQEIQDEIVVEEKQVEQKTQSQKRKKTVRYFLLGFFLLALILVGVNMITTYEKPIKTGTGGVTGQVVNQSLTPVVADIYVLDSDLSEQSASDGSFTLINLPAGQINLIVAYQGQGVEIPIMIESGEISILGQIKVESTQIPSSQ